LISIGPQSILNSDRIILNAKKDSILISGYQSVGISAGDTVDIESNNIILEGNTFLGSNTATESALLGDTTVFYLSQLATAVKALASIIETSQLFPGGVPVPDAAGGIIGGNASSVVSDVLNNLNKLKSKIVKVK